MTKFGILDDEGRVVRWVWELPGPGYEFIVVKISKAKRPTIDISTLPDALL